MHGAVAQSALESQPFRVAHFEFSHLKSNEIFCRFQKSSVVFKVRELRPHQDVEASVGD